MATRFSKQFFSLALLVVIFFGVPQADADEVSDAAAEVTRTLDALFVKAGKSGPMLREALQPEQLRALLAEGAAASKRKGARLVERYSKTIPESTTSTRLAVVWTR